MSATPARLDSTPNADARTDSAMDTRDYQTELEFLFGRLNYERAPERARSVADFRLDRMRELLMRLDHPERTLPCIHITGSKGKGSVATMVARILEDAGLKVGLFTSPHVTEYGERMTINGRFPRLATLVPLMRLLRSVALAMDAESEHGRPTFFELTTALGWLHFQSEAVDYVVLEVGLGGRLDSTNLCSPLVSIITSISFDHMRLLGDTLPEIAREKAGIIKRCVPVISGVVTPEVRDVVRQVAAQVGAPLRELEIDFRVSTQATPGPSPAIAPADSHLADSELADAAGLPRPTFSANGCCGQWEGLQLGMPGEHQIRNAGVALAAIAALKQAGMSIPDAAVRTGLRRAVVPCRIEVLGRSPLIVVDAAHNPASVQALCDTLASRATGKFVVIFGASRDKDAAAMLRILDGFADQLILTRYLNNPRAMTIPELEELAVQGISQCPRTTASDPASALALARTCATSQDLIAITGSLFLAAEFRELLISGSGTRA